MIDLDEGRITLLPLCDYSFTIVITTVYPKVHKSLILVTSDHLTILQGHYNCISRYSWKFHAFNSGR